MHWIGWSMEKHMSFEEFIYLYLVSVDYITTLPVDLLVFPRQ